MGLLPSQRVSQVSNPSGWLTSLRGRAPLPPDQKLWDWASPGPGPNRDGSHTPDSRPDVGWPETPARAAGCARTGSGLMWLQGNRSSGE